MPKRIYVGNLPFDVEREDIGRLLDGQGEVKSVDLQPDSAKKTTIAIIVFEGEGPNTVVKALNGRNVAGRKIVVSTDREVVINHEEQY